MKRYILLLVLLAATPVAAAAQRQNSIVGSWNLVSYEDTSDKGAIEYPWGKHPSGLLIYDDTDHMAVQIQRTPIEKSISKPESKLTRADKESLLGSYTAYFGTYSVDWEHMTVTHHVKGNLFPVYIETDQAKGFEVNGDRFVLKASWTANGRRWNGIRVFERMKPSTDR